MPHRATALLVVASVALAACGGGAARAGDPTRAPALRRAEPDRPPDPHAAASDQAPDRNVILPFVAVAAPDLPFLIASLEVASEDEELAFELGPKEGEVAEVIEGVREVALTLTGDAGEVRPVTIGGREAHMLAIAGEDRGRRVAFGFAVVETEDGRHARLSYQVRGLADAAAALDRVLASFSTQAPAAPAAGFRVVGVAGYFFEAPARAVVGRATLMYDDDAEVEVRVAPAPTSPDDGFLARATTSPINTVRRVTNVERRDIAFGGVAGTVASYDIVVEGGPTFPERAAEAELADRIVVFVRTSRLPPAVIEALAASARLEPR